MLFLLHYRRQPVVDLICYLARSANLPTGLYILLALISSFFLFLTMSKAISVSTGPIATNATKILAKISPVISAENILIEIVLPVHVVVRRMSSNTSGCTNRFSQSFHHMNALYMSMMDLYHILQFFKGRCHGNQIILP